MRLIHVLRKPLSEGTVASNVLKHGCGGLNIDASRIGTEQVFTHSRGLNRAFPKRPGETSVEESGRKARQDILDHSPRTGRWPANVILQHLDGCWCDGVKTAGSGRFVAHDAVVRESTMMDPGKGWNGNSLDNSKKNAPNSYGKETVANWICEPGCPVARLDEQSGVTKSTGGRTVNISTTSTIYGGGKGLGQEMSSDEVRGDPGFGDTGGASRFYKQIGGSGE